MKIGLFGGTFDPIHNGHLIIAEWVRQELELNRLVFIPAGKPPHKQKMPVSSKKHRLAMVQLAVKDNPAFEVSEIETARTGKSYSIETIRELQKSYTANSKLFWIIGSDSLIDLPNWFLPKKIIKTAQVVVYPRINYKIKNADRKYRNNALILNSPIVEISSSNIRERVKQAKSIRYLTPLSVEKYIYKAGLYKNP